MLNVVGSIMKNKELHIKHIRRIIILGHSGFIGSKLLTYCKKINSHIEVFGLSREDIDLTKHAVIDKISGLFTDSTAVVMLAGIKPVVNDDLSTFSQNLSLVVNLCHVLQNHPVNSCLFLSSASVYGEDIQYGLISELTAVQPRSFYAMAKYISERLLWKVFFDQEKTEAFTILRPPAIYGAGEQRISYNPAGFFEKAVKGEEVKLWGDGTEKREFIYVDDIVELMYYFIFHPHEGVVNIVSGTSYTFKGAIDIIRKLLGKKFRVVSRERSKEKVDVIFDNQLMKRLVPGFKFTSLEKGLTNIFRS